VRAPRLLTVLVLVGVALGASACGERSEPIGEIAPSYPVTVQGADDQAIELTESPKRIVALDAGSAGLIVALGAGDRLVGAPAGVKVPDRKGVAEVVRRTGQVDVDAVVRAKPDLIVATPDTDRVDVSQAERQTGAPVYLQPSRSVEDVEQAALDLGFLVGEPATARQLLGRIKRGVAEVDARLEGVKPVTVFVDRGFLLTVPQQSFLGDLVRRARGVNIARDYAGLGPFPVARLKKANPDVYLATSDSGVTLEKLRRDPATKDLEAVREGRVVILPADLVTRAGPRVARALEEVAAAIHPDAFR
jgi:iron complex transport system substrate-binding protein